MRSIFYVPRSERAERSRVPPAARAGFQINARIVWASCAVVLGGAALAAWFGQETAREVVVLSPQARVLPQSVSEPSMEQFPGLVSPPSVPAVATLAAAPVALQSLPPTPAVELSRLRAESAAITAGASTVPVSTWPAAVTRGPNEVPPRSDMRYQGGRSPVQQN